jgi:deoxyribodipyrimidine photo-lyase
MFSGTHLFMPPLSIVWFREDLRLSDNPALSQAAARGGPVLPVFVLDEETAGIRPPGGASRWWLHHSLAALASSLEQAGSPLLILRGPALDVLGELAERLSPAAVFWNRRYGKAERDVDAAIKAHLGGMGVDAQSWNASLLYEPWTVRGQSGGPLKVFTPFWRAARATGEPDAPLAQPASLQAPSPATLANLPRRVSLHDLDLLPRRPDWAGGLREAWRPGEAGAAARLEEFLARELRGYASNRDRPDLPGTSRLSPHLHFGEIGPRQVWHAAAMAQATGETGASDTDFTKFLAEIGWREFSYSLLFHNPDLARANYQPRFDAFGWRDDSDALRRWQKGQTGYPIVDAGMRQLWKTGWMHNRVRMITASFLIKHLLVDWRRGEEWFWDTLVDADPASNAASWQWVAGSGADAAPYYRIFNPFTQGEKFDPEGTYVRAFVPELGGLPPDLIHRPWEASPEECAAAGVRLGETYPRPIVDHGEARIRALAALEKLKPISD